MRIQVVLAAIALGAASGAAHADPFKYTFSFEEASQNGISLAADTVTFDSPQLLDGTPPFGLFASPAPGEDLNGLFTGLQVALGSPVPAFDGGPPPVGIAPAGTVLSFFFALGGSALPGPGIYNAVNAYRVVSDGTGSGLFGNTVNIASAATLTITDLAPVPLPAAAWLLLSGLGGLGVFARRRS